jgi:hypothetical protein
MFALPCSLQSLIHCLVPVFTAPTFQTQTEIFLGWMMCLTRRSEFSVFRTIHAHEALNRKQRHPFDRFYNFFARSAWTVADLGRVIAIQIVIRMCLEGSLQLVTDSTLIHKRGKNVYGLGWFRDAVRSTKKRVATASGNQWVVVALVVPVPGTDIFLTLPIHVDIHVPGENQPGEAALVKKMLKEILQWFPDRNLILVGDGGFSNKKLLKGLDRGRVTYVGVIRRDAEIYDPIPPKQPKSKPGPKPKKGGRHPSPKQAALKANRARSKKSPWAWRTITATAYGVTRTLEVVTYQAVWPEVMGSEPILVVVVRDPLKQFQDKYLFTTDIHAEARWVVETYAKRWCIEVTFKASKQTLGIEQPQHWCKNSIKKLAPWVWLMQSLVILWYLTDGRQSSEASEERGNMGEWETEWSFRHMYRVCRKVILRTTISRHSGTKAELAELISALESYLNLAA